MHRIALFAALVAPMPAAAQDAPVAPAAAPVAAPELDARVAQLPELMHGGGDFASFFAPGFRAQVPEAQFRALSEQMVADADAPPAILSVAVRTPYQAIVDLAVPAGRLAVAIAVDPVAPHAVTGLRLLGVTAIESTIDQVAAAIEALPGATGYAWARLGAGAPEMVRGDSVDTAFGVGSAYKLWILAELVRAVDAGERAWDDRIALDGSALPGSAYAAVPAGTEVALRDLAEAMIAVSDNGATDILLRDLGRERVEAMMAQVGVAPEQVARNTPLLGTLEFFKLKGAHGGALGRRWIAADARERRALLDGPVAATPASAIDPAVFATGRPVMIEDIEFFASPADLVRTMDWLRRNTADDPVARAILAKNSGIAPAAARSWRFVGYKGGSELGVINMTLLLEDRDGKWHVLTASWNNPEAAVDESRFGGLIGRWAELAAPR